jgi:hypothetical protein
MAPPLSHGVLHLLHTLMVFVDLQEVVRLDVLTRARIRGFTIIISSNHLSSILHLNFVKEQSFVLVDGTKLLEQSSC